MTTTSQDGADGAPGSLPGTNAPGASKEQGSVPLGEHIEMRQKMRALADELAEVKTKLSQSVDKSASAAPQTPRGDQSDPRLNKIEERLRLKDLADELGLSSREQSAAVLDIMAKNPDLTPVEALKTAAERKKDLFKDGGQSDAGKPQFGSLRPSPGAQPEPPSPSDYKQRLEHVAALRKTDKRAALRMGDNVMGGMLAKAMGWEHKKLPLPRKQ